MKTRWGSLLQTSASLAHESPGSCSFLDELELASSTDETSSTGSNETALLSAGSVSTHGSGVTNVLMVTTTMRMLDGVHGNTSNSGPVSLLGVGLEVGVVGLQEGLVSSLATSDDADHTSAGALDSLSNTRGHSDSGLLEVLGVTDDNARVAGGTGDAATVTELSLNVGDDGTFGHGVHGEDIADGEGGYLIIIT